MKKINFTDEEFLRTKVHELGELSVAFCKAADEIILRDKYYEKKGFKDLISMRQDCFAVSNSLAAAHSALINILNKSANIPSNIQKLKEKKCQKTK